MGGQGSGGAKGGRVLTAGSVRAGGGVAGARGWRSACLASVRAWGEGWTVAAGCHHYTKSPHAHRH